MWAMPAASFFVRTNLAQVIWQRVGKSNKKHTKKNELRWIRGLSNKQVPDITLKTTQRMKVTKTRWNSYSVINKRRVHALMFHIRCNFSSMQLCTFLTHAKVLSFINIPVKYGRKAKLEKGVSDLYTLITVISYKGPESSISCGNFISWQPISYYLSFSKRTRTSWR